MRHVKPGRWWLTAGPIRLALALAWGLLLTVVNLMAGSLAIGVASFVGTAILIIVGLAGS